jgi:hypothetical protein
MNCERLISSVVALALGVAAISGAAGAVQVCLAQLGDCTEAWKAAGVGALQAATVGGTLLARLPQRKQGPDTEEPDP